MVVVYPGIISDLYFPSERNAISEQLHQQVKGWIAPMSWKSQFLNMLTIYFRKNLISYNQITDGFKHADEWMVSIDPQEFMDVTVGQLKNSSCSYYDCEYIALAKVLNTKLITTNKQLLTQFPDVAFTPEDYLAKK